MGARASPARKRSTRPAAPVVENGSPPSQPRAKSPHRQKQRLGHPAVDPVTPVEGPTLIGKIWQAAASHDCMPRGSLRAETKNLRKHFTSIRALSPIFFWTYALSSFTYSLIGLAMCADSTCSLLCRGRCDQVAERCWFVDAGYYTSTRSCQFRYMERRRFRWTSTQLSLSFRARSRLPLTLGHARFNSLRSTPRTSPIVY